MTSNDLEEALRESGPSEAVTLILAWDAPLPPAGEREVVSRAERRERRREHYRRIKEPVLEQLRKQGLTVNNDLTDTPQAIVSGAATVIHDILHQPDSPFKTSNLSVIPEGPIYALERP